MSFITIVLLPALVSAVRINRKEESSDFFQCPAGSTTFTLSPHVPPLDGSFNRVIMADYPSTGSTWLKKLVEEVSWNSGTASPSCSIYSGCLVDKPGVKCPCGRNLKGHAPWTKKQGSLFFKTHFPCQHQFRGDELHGWQYDGSSHFNKLLLLARHPVATVGSNIRRWGGSPSTLKANIKCWGTWWERARAAVGETNVHVIRYEDLCLNTASVVFGFLQFLGGSYKDVTLQSIQQTLQRNPKLQCFYSSAEIAARTRTNTPQQYSMLSDLMNRWGYPSNALSAAALYNTSDVASSGQASLMKLRDEDGVLSPWSANWTENLEAFF